MQAMRNGGWWLWAVGDDDEEAALLWKRRRRRRITWPHLPHHHPLLRQVGITTMPCIRYIT